MVFKHPDLKTKVRFESDVVDGVLEHLDLDIFWTNGPVQIKNQDVCWATTSNSLMKTPFCLCGFFFFFLLPLICHIEMIKYQRV